MPFNWRRIGGVSIVGRKIEIAWTQGSLGADGYERVSSCNREYVSEALVSQGRECDPPADRSDSGGPSRLEEYRKDPRSSRPLH